jgi:hypothetical protein
MITCGGRTLGGVLVPVGMWGYAPAVNAVVRVGT